MLLFVFKWYLTGDSKFKRHEKLFESAIRAFLKSPPTEKCILKPHKAAVQFVYEQIVKAAYTVHFTTSRVTPRQACVHYSGCMYGCMQARQ